MDVVVWVTNSQKHEGLIDLRFGPAFIGQKSVKQPELALNNSAPYACRQLLRSALRTNDGLNARLTIAAP